MKKKVLLVLAFLLLAGIAIAYHPRVSLVPPTMDSIASIEPYSVQPLPPKPKNGGGEEKRVAPSGGSSSGKPNYNYPTCYRKYSNHSKYLGVITPKQTVCWEQLLSMNADRDMSSVNAIFINR